MRARWRRRRRLAALATVVAGIVVIAIVAIVVRSSAPPGRPAPLATTLVSNPLGEPWWADGLLHLAEVSVASPAPESLVQVGTGPSYGAAFTTSTGAVDYASPHGTITRIGTGQPGNQIAADQHGDGAVAWIEPGDPPSIVVWDASSGTVAGRRSVVAAPRGSDALRRTHPLAVTADSVAWIGADGTWTWALSQRPERVAGPDQLIMALGPSVPGGVLAGSGTHGSTIIWRPPGAAPITRVSGAPLLTPGGSYLVSHPISTLGYVSAHLLEVATGEVRRVSLTSAQQVAVSAFAVGPGDEVTFVIGQDPPAMPTEPGAPPTGPPDRTYTAFDLVSCDVARHACTTAVSGASTTDNIVLPGR